MDYGKVVAAALEYVYRNGKQDGKRFTMDSFGDAIGEVLGGEGYSRQSVNNWLDRSAKPPAIVLLAAARLGGMTVDELLIRADSEWATSALADLSERVSRLEGSSDINPSKGSRNIVGKSPTDR